MHTQVDTPDLLEHFPEEFYQHEHVEVLIEHEPSANGDKIMRCVNGIVLRVENNVYDVLDLDGKSSQPCVHRVHSQVGAGTGRRRSSVPVVLVTWRASNVGSTRTRQTRTPNTHKQAHVHTDWSRFTAALAFYPCVCLFISPHQLLRKRFLYGEQVECYLKQAGLAQGWFKGYVVGQKPNAAASSTHMRHNKFQHHVSHCTNSMYDVFLRGSKGGVRAQKVQVPSYCIRKLLGFSLERIFPNRKRQTRSQELLTADADKKELSKLLGTFREGLRASDKIMVAVMEGVASVDQQSFRRATCTRAPGTCVFAGVLLHYWHVIGQTCMIVF